MRLIVPITLVTAGLVLAVGLLGGLSTAERVGLGAGLALAYALICVWGTVSLGSGVFGRAHLRGDPSRPRVALTWDDGPDSHVTPALLDLLAERGVRATFFFVGERARLNPELVRRCAREGHGIGNHSDGHAALTNLFFGGRMDRELRACQETLATLTGQAPRYYRPPMGLMNHAVAGAAAANHLQIVGWQVRSLDTSARTAAEVIARVMKHIEPGGIVLLHDGQQDHERTLAIARGLLDGLAAKGLEPVRVDQLGVETGGRESVSS